MRKYLVALIFFISGSPAFCQWNSDTQINNVVANSSRDDVPVAAVTDGAGGSIITIRDNDKNDIYIQKITSAGVVAWGGGTTSPIPVSVNVQYKSDASIIADGNGGAFIAWSQYLTSNDKGEIYLQKINNAGVIQWIANGKRVTNSTDIDDSQPILSSDGAGGVIITWFSDDSAHKNIQAFVQRYNSAGTAQWTANGLQVCTAPGFRGGTQMVSDGSNGAIIFFIDTRNDPHGTDYSYLTNDNNDLTNADIYAQRINGSGARLWTNNGAAIATSAGSQIGTGNAVSDGNGGAIAVYYNDGSSRLFAQRVNSNGQYQWPAGGATVSATGGNYGVSSAISDGTGGAVISFDNDAGNQVFSQRINAAGAVVWTVNGVAISPATDAGYSSSMTNDGNGNTLIAYYLNSSASNSVRCQKLTAAGKFQWDSAGIIICNAGYPDNPLITLSDGGSAIVTWGNYLNNNFSQDVYAAKVLANGTLAGGTVVVNQYISAANGNWNNPSTWVGGVVPPNGASVTIHHAVSCNINTSCSSVKVELAAGNLTVLTGFTLKITN